MKKLLLILVAPILLFSCSSDDSTAAKSGSVEDPAQISGTWNLSAKYNYNTTTNIATECDIQFGKFIFSSNAVEKRGGDTSGSCTEQSYTYDSYTIVEGQIKFLRNNAYQIYNVDYETNKLWLTRVATQPVGGALNPIPLEDQVTNYYQKQQ